MTLFVDASAAVAMLSLEDDAQALFDRVDADDNRLWSALARWETTVAFARVRATTVDQIADEVELLASRLEFRLIPIAETETVLALKAHQRYGKRSGHPAQLNMGDCFSYACAKAYDAQLLYKGDDFRHTDLA